MAKPNPIIADLRATPPDGASTAAVDRWLKTHGYSCASAGPKAAGKEARDVPRAVKELGVNAVVKLVERGPRVDRYTITLAKAADVGVFGKLSTRLSAAIGLPVSTLPTDQPRAVYADVTREKGSWKTYGLAELRAMVAKARGTLPLVLGVDPVGKPVIIDLADAPHALIAGTTGSGKSCLLHVAIASLVLKKVPVKWVLIDPKRVELGLWKPRAWKSASDDADIVSALAAVVGEMNARYKKMEKAGQTMWSGERIIVVVDELAELVDTVPTSVESLRTLARKARAAGIHLLLATQRPDAETLDGQLRSNIPVRIALGVQKATESRIILDVAGAELLPRPGEILARTSAGLLRVHGLYLQPKELATVAKEGI